MSTIKLEGCGGINSFLNLFTCSSCISKNDKQACADILKRNRTTKHKEYCSDMIGRMWNKKCVTYYIGNENRKTWKEYFIDE